MIPADLKSPQDKFEFLSLEFHVLYFVYLMLFIWNVNGLFINLNNYYAPNLKLEEIAIICVFFWWLWGQHG